MCGIRSCQAEALEILRSAQNDKKTKTMSLDKLFNPKSIAVVGASSEEGKVGNVIAKNILELGYAGQVFLVNPKHEEILGQKGYKSLAEIKEEIDLAIVAIPAKFVNEEIKKNAKKIKNFLGNSWNS